MICRAPEKKDPHERYQPDHRMKQPIPHHIHVHGFEGRRGHPVGDHVVPLQDLVQDNAIDKAPQADAEHNACTLRFPMRDASCHREVPTPCGHSRSVVMETYTTPSVLAPFIPSYPTTATPREEGRWAKKASGGVPCAST
jgi:hypothetical protein